MTTSIALPTTVVSSSHEKGTLLRHLPTVARVLLGAVFFTCGLNGFLNFLPRPSDPVPEGAMAFASGLLQSGYMFPLIAGTELAAGALLLINRWVPLALAILAPVLINIVLFHVFLAPAGLFTALVLFAFETRLAWSYRRAYAPMLRARVTAS